MSATKCDTRSFVGETSSTPPEGFIASAVSVSTIRSVAINATRHTYRGRQRARDWASTTGTQIVVSVASMTSSQSAAS